MTFNSLQYALFLPVVVIGFWLLPGRGSIRRWTNRPARRWVPDVRQVWLLAASYVFYAAFDWRFAFLLLFTTVVDYGVGLRLDALPDGSRRARRLTLLVSLAVNLGVLGFFKYFDFFVDQGVELLTQIGLEPATPALRILLPYGISFYTFQSMGYTIDVYRREIRACRDPLDFATFVAFFPQLVAGPISRAKNLLPQIQADRSRPNADQVTSGLLLILLGLFKKVVIADSLAPTREPRLRFGRSGTGVGRSPACSRSRSRSTATSPATPTWPAGRRGCWASSSSTTSTSRTCRAT